MNHYFHNQEYYEFPRRSGLPIDYFHRSPLIPLIVASLLLALATATVWLL